MNETACRFVEKYFDYRYKVRVFKGRYIERQRTCLLRYWVFDKKIKGIAKMNSNLLATDSDDLVELDLIKFIETATFVVESKERTPTTMEEAFIEEIVDTAKAKGYVCAIVPWTSGYVLGLNDKAYFVGSINQAISIVENERR